ncbi:stage II sporulation protein P [Salibacterium salarium]|uniref:stage II sporulation protein P n=1 Tax=Salibacterium salarium TaxID=284579 RepID=UPI0024831A1B|nr:stage II sporulation protein P [Salibacterium salarium]
MIFEVPQSNENMEFVKKLASDIEEKYPGISRGILEKNVSEEKENPNIIRIGIGGKHNTLEEKQNAIDIIIDILEE